MAGCWLFCCWSGLELDLLECWMGIWMFRWIIGGTVGCTLFCTFEEGCTTFCTLDVSLDLVRGYFLAKIIALELCEGFFKR